MRERNRLSYVSERDIDFLLLEELNVNQEFAAWFFSQAKTEPITAPICSGAWHSVTDPQLGESDLVVIYKNGFAILIENKVDAPAQPDQAERYRKRGALGIDQKLWDSFSTCIVAPSRYINANSEAKNYDLRLSYEHIQTWLDQQNSQRFVYRSYVLGEAIEQNRRGYSPIADQDVTQFWMLYWELANKEYPSLKMPRPRNKPGNSDWPDFRPSELSKKLNIVHKMAQGCVDLQVRGAVQSLDRIRSMIKDVNLDVVAAGKSAAIRVAVAPVDRFGSFEGQRDEIFRALKAADRLLQIARDIRDHV